eukprot:SAG11_NODE_867_length_6831_cov_5.720737_4_plen_189_part_00
MVQQPHPPSQPPSQPTPKKRKAQRNALTPYQVELNTRAKAEREAAAAREAAIAAAAVRRANEREAADKRQAVLEAKRRLQAIDRRRYTVYIQARWRGWRVRHGAWRTAAATDNRTSETNGFVHARCAEVACRRDRRDFLALLMATLKVDHPIAAHFGQTLVLTNAGACRFRTGSAISLRGSTNKKRTG